jgi:hypothetical protein
MMIKARMVSRGTELFLGGLHAVMAAVTFQSFGVALSVVFMAAALLSIVRAVLVPREGGCAPLWTTWAELGLGIAGLVVLARQAFLG